MHTKYTHPKKSIKSSSIRSNKDHLISESSDSDSDSLHLPKVNKKTTHYAPTKYNKQKYLTDSTSSESIISDESESDSCDEYKPYIASSVSQLKKPSYVNTSGTKKKATLKEMTDSDSDTDTEKKFTFSSIPKKENQLADMGISSDMDLTECDEEYDIRSLCHAKINDQYSYCKYLGHDAMVMMKNGYINITQLCEKYDTTFDFYQWSKDQISNDMKQCLCMPDEKLMYPIVNNLPTDGIYVHPSLVPAMLIHSDPSLTMHMNDFFITKQPHYKSDPVFDNMQSKNINVSGNKGDNSLLVIKRDATNSYCVICTTHGKRDFTIEKYQKMYPDMRCIVELSGLNNAELLWTNIARDLKRKYHTNISIDADNFDIRNHTNEIYVIDSVLEAYYDVC